MKRLLKNTEFNIFPIVMGSDYFGGAISKETAFENLDLYTEYGGNIIDTARLYVNGKSEEIIGKYLKERNLAVEELVDYVPTNEISTVTAIVGHNNHLRGACGLCPDQQDFNGYSDRGT